jgi:hypothetical protein
MAVMSDKDDALGLQHPRIVPGTMIKFNSMIMNIFHAEDIDVPPASRKIFIEKDLSMLIMILGTLHNVKGAVDPVYLVMTTKGLGMIVLSGLLDCYPASERYFSVVIR